jgi:hypothetical protein
MLVYALRFGNGSACALLLLYGELEDFLLPSDLELSVTTYHKETMAHTSTPTHTRLTKES